MRRSHHRITLVSRSKLLLVIAGYCQALWSLSISVSPSMVQTTSWKRLTTKGRGEPEGAFTCSGVPDCRNSLLWLVNFAKHRYEENHVELYRLRVLTCGGIREFPIEVI